MFRCKNIEFQIAPFLDGVVFKRKVWCGVLKGSEIPFKKTAHRTYLIVRRTFITLTNKNVRLEILDCSHRRRNQNDGVDQ